MVLSFLREKSKSLTGKHSVYANVFHIVDDRVENVNPYRKEECKPLYRVGKAEKLYLKPGEPGDREAYVWVWFIRNLRGKVKGRIEVYDASGTLRLIAKYVKLKVRRSKGDSSYSWAVKMVMDYLKLPVKRYNFSTGTD